MGQIVLERAGGIQLPEQDQLVPERPEDLLHDEIRIFDQVARGLSAPDAARAIDVSERKGYQLLESGREKVDARTYMHATRIYADLGLLLPLRRRSSAVPARLSPSEFIIASLGSRGWTNNDMLDIFGGARSNINTQWQHIRRKMDQSKGSEEAVRRALGIGVLAFDRTLVPADS